MTWLFNWYLFRRKSVVSFGRKPTRKLRYLEKVRYKWRRSRTIIRHVLLQFQNWLTTKQITAKPANQ